MEKISPRVDVAFKKLFGVEENKDLLISLINSIVSEEDQVEDITLLNPYNEKTFRNDKLSILDIKATGHGGKMFNIEMQITDAADYDKRALYYWGKLYTEQLRTGENYSILSKAIGIHILNFTSIVEAKKYHNVFHITEKDDGFRFFKDLELHTIELNKFTGDPKEELSDIVAKVKTSLDRWCAFLARNDLFKRGNLPAELDNPDLDKAINVLEVMSFTEEEREIYEGHLKWLRDEAAALQKAEEKGIEIGIEQGIEIGEARGIDKGIEKGIEQTALNMIHQSFDIEVISKITGLSISEIQKLKDGSKNDS